MASVATIKFTVKKCSNNVSGNGGRMVPVCFTAYDMTAYGPFYRTGAHCCPTTKKQI